MLIDILRSVRPSAMNINKSRRLYDLLSRRKVLKAKLSKIAKVLGSGAPRAFRDGWVFRGAICS